jgi:inner membrane protein YidH
LFDASEVDILGTARQNASMSVPTPSAAHRAPSASDYLAAERTFLAWIRTGLALMGFGFVVARFGLFLQQVRLVEPRLPTRSYGLSIWFGTALIAAGVLVDIYASWNHVRLLRRLNHGGMEFTRPSGGALALAIFLALVGVAMAIYLISV